MIHNFKQFLFVYGALALFSFTGSAIATYLIKQNQTKTIIKTISLECKVEE